MFHNTNSTACNTKKPAALVNGIASLQPRKTSALVHAALIAARLGRLANCTSMAHAQCRSRADAGDAALVCTHIAVSNHEARLDGADAGWRDHRPCDKIVPGAALGARGAARLGAQACPHCFRMVSFCLLTMEFMRLSPAASVYDSSSPPLPRQNVSASICVLQVAKYSSVQAPSTMVSTGVWPAAAGAAAAALTLGSETSHALY